MRIAALFWPCPPPREVSLYGYDHRPEHQPVGNDGVLDPTGIAVQLWSFEEGAQRSLRVLIQLDGCVISNALASNWRQAVVNQFASNGVVIALAEVWIVASHTHSGPVLDDPSVLSDIKIVLPHSGPAMISTAVVEFTQRLRQAMLGAVAEAYDQLSSDSSVVRQARCIVGSQDQAYCRRVMTEHGLAMCWNSKEQAYLQPTPIRSLTALWLWDCADCQVGLSTLPAHPVVLGQESRLVSADWPGAVRTAALKDGVKAMVLMGAAGDAHPWQATQTNPQAVKQVGSAMWSCLADIRDGKGGENSENQIITALPDRAPLVKEQHFQFGGPEVVMSCWSWPGRQILQSVSGELFYNLGERWQANLVERLGSLLVTNANGWSGYWPESKDYAVGNYEVDAAQAMNITRGDDEKLLAKLIEQVQ